MLDKIIMTTATTNKPYRKKCDSRKTLKTQTHNKPRENEATGNSIESEQSEKY